MGFPLFLQVETGGEPYLRFPATEQGRLHAGHNGGQHPHPFRIRLPRPD